MLVFIQPATHNTTMVTNVSSMKEMMAHLNLESANVARLMSINSSSSNFMLRTFLSSTETVKVEELKDDMAEGAFSRLMHALSFQCVTRLQNYISSNQVGDMKRAFMSRRQTVASEGRTIDGKLTPGFLGAFAAAVHVDKAARDKFKISRPKPQAERFINQRA